MPLHAGQKPLAFPKLARQNCGSLTNLIRLNRIQAKDVPTTFSRILVWRAQNPRFHAIPLVNLGLQFVVRLRPMSDGDPRINFPATCPECGKQWVMNFKSSYIAECLNAGEPIKMYAQCHDKTWDASAAELQQLSLLLDRWETDGGKPV
jgi:hypothetical protein